MLCDTGPLVALIDADDAYHPLANQTILRLASERLETTWPCITEALYLLGRYGGHRAQNSLLEWIELGAVLVIFMEQDAIRRIRVLMKKYADAPMDFADASLVAAAESNSETKIFTFDSHFRTYLIHDRIPFEVIP